MNKKLEKRIRLKKKIRTKVSGTEVSPRLSVFRSNQYIYAQVIDDGAKKTLVSASDMPVKKAGATKVKGSKTERAILVGEQVTKALKAKGIKKVVFDRNGFKYTGRIKALADSARTSGLEF
ncbi:MAG: 50S ribosomal protein L18 [Patescibacteria group bacterium]|nr:50S ribosomal protein L18 [Patescibacteria group bacterium]